MGKHIDITRPVDAPTDHAARYARHAAPAPTWQADAWSDDPDRTTRRGDTAPTPYFRH